MANIMKKQDKSDNDWEQSDEDDNWDDWGDDDEKFEDLSEAPDVQQAKLAANSSSKNNDAKVEEEAQQAQIPSKATTPSSATSTTSSWGLWGGKLTSVLSTATEGLGNITTQVNQGLNQIIGVPDPEELARINASEQAKKETEAKEKMASAEPKQENEEDTSPKFALDFVTTLGSKVLNTGLDTLEGIGKKTMTILQENDPKLMNKRKLLGLDANKPNLSAVLLEAKKDADQMEQSLRQLQLEKQKAQLRFEILFENYCGLVHYEALEILSKESRLKLDTLLDAVSGNALAELHETINEVQELLELESLECESEGDYEPSELQKRLLSTIADAELQMPFEDIANHWSKSLEWLQSEESTAADLEQTYAKSIHALSEACALLMCKLHKIAELLLVKSHHSTANEVDAVVQLCRQCNTHLQGLTHRFAAVLSSKAEGEDPDAQEQCKTQVNTLFSEMLASLQYIEQAYKLFAPILQMGAV